MTRFRTGLGGAVTGFVLSLSQVMLLAETVAPWLHYGWWTWLMGAVVMASITEGCILALCVSAYRDRAAEAAGYCRPLRKKVR